MKIRHATALLPLILLVGCALNGENQIRKLDLKGLCTKEQIFQYEDFSWGMDTEETFNQSSLKFDEKDLGQTQDSAKTYTSEEELSLDNAKANMNLEFSNDQLNQLSFTFYLEKDAKEWIQKEVDELNSLYGDVETTGLDNQTYQWSGEQNTVLQMVVFSKNDEKVAETFRSSRCHCGTAAYCAVFGSDDPGNPYAERKCAGKSDRWHEEKLDGHADRHERSAGRADKREWKQPAADAESAVRKSGYAGDGERIVKRKRS